MAGGHSLMADIRSHVVTRGPSCSVGAVVDTLNVADRADLDAALADITIPTSAIHRALQGRGLKTGLGVVQKHRTGGCSCVTR